MTEIDPEDAKVTLKLFRALRDLSQVELADKAGIAKRSLVRYEVGKPITAATLVQISEAAGVPETTLFTLVLPLIRYLRNLNVPLPEFDEDDESDKGLVEAAVNRAVEASAATTRAAFLRAWNQHVQDTIKCAENAWRPLPEHRAWGADLWQRMEPLQPEEWAVLLNFGQAFHHWALAEKAADVAVETLQTDTAKARLRAQLAVDVADRVQGSEPWKARIRAYALAALGRVLVETGEVETGGEKRVEAVRLWKVGEEDAGRGPLLEERFLGWAGGGDEEPEPIGG